MITHRSRIENELHMMYKTARCSAVIVLKMNMLQVEQDQLVTEMRTTLENEQFKRFGRGRKQINLESMSQHNYSKTNALII